MQNGEEHRALQRGKRHHGGAGQRTTPRQPVSSHNRSNASAGPMRRAELVVASPAAAASTTMALAAKRAPERSRRSNCPLSRKSSTRPSVSVRYDLLAHRGAFATAFDDLEIGAPARGFLTGIHDGVDGSDL